MQRSGSPHLALDQLKAFLQKMQDDQVLREQVLSASTADDVALIALKLGYEFSGDELLRFSGKRWAESRSTKMTCLVNIINGQGI